MTVCEQDVGSRGGFSATRMLEQADTSRGALGREAVFILYLHNPDLETDLDETLGAVDELHKAGFFSEFGVSNFPAWVRRRPRRASFSLPFLVIPLTAFIFLLFSLPLFCDSTALLFLPFSRPSRAIPLPFSCLNDDRCPQQVMQIFDRCKTNGYVLPTVCK